MEAREGDEVVFVVGVKVEDGVADLADVDGAAERGFLRVVAGEVHAVRGVADVVGCDRRVMRDLLADEGGCAALVFPFAEEELAEERVQGLLLAAEFFVTTGVLLFEGAEEPFEHEQHSFLRVLLGGGGDKEVGHLSPVRREFGEGGGGEDESGSGHGG